MKPYGKLYNNDINVSIAPLDIYNFYPVGSIYLSVVNINPSTYFGGTWEAIEGVFLLGCSSEHIAGTTGGEVTHKLTVNEMPSHSHRIYGYYNMTPQGGNYVAGGVVATVPQHYGNYPEKTGGSQAHNNMPPYLVVYMWKRIS